MGGRGRGRGRGFGRGQSFTNSDQQNVIPIEKIQSAHITPTYPPLNQFPAPLVNNPDFDEMSALNNQLISHFQSSNYYLKMEDEHTRLFTSQGEAQSSKKISLNFDWNFFPLELRPVGKRKLKNESDLLSHLRKNTTARIDLSWLDKLEEKEKKDVEPLLDLVKEEPIKQEPEIPDDEEVEEFDDEEMDADNDYNTNYFDDGGGYLDEDDDMDEPCY